MSGRRSGTTSARPTSGRMPLPPETLVARERLYTCLDAATRFPLTQIIAPAGTGKTVLAASWALAERSERTNGAIGWLGTADHPRLAATMMEMADQDDAGAPAGTTRRPSARAVVCSLEARLEHRDPPRLLVVDDAHLLDRDQTRFLADVLSTVPDAVRLLLVSRRDLNLPVVELSLHGKATSIRGRQLRFTAAEATRLIRAHAPGVGAAEIETLHRRTDGWAAALVLGARTFGPGIDPGVARDLFESTDQPVLDFLLSETFGTLDPQARTVLLSTFDEPEISPRRATTMSADPEAGRVLNDLADAGLLVSAHLGAAGEAPVFRYHPLLVELLRREAARPGEHAAIIASAHRRTAMHDADDGRIDDAVRHAVQAHDDDLLTGLLIEHGPTLICTGENDLVAAGLRMLSTSRADEHHALVALSALSRREAGDTTTAVRLARRALEHGIDARPGGADAIAEASTCDEAILRLWLSRCGLHAADAAVSSAHLLLGCVVASGDHAAHRSRLVAEPERLAWLLIELAATEICTGDLTTAETHLDEALVSARMSGSARLQGAALAHLSVVHYARSAVRTARATAAQALEIGPDRPEQAVAVLGLAAFQQLDSAEARARCEELDRTVASQTDRVVTALHLLLRALLATEQGQPAEARLILAGQPVVAGDLPDFLSRDLAVVRWLCATAGGDRQAAERQLGELAGRGHQRDAVLLTALGMALTGAADAGHAIERSLDHGGQHPLIVAAAAGVRVALLVRTGERDRAQACLSDLLNQVAPQQPLQALTMAASDPGFLDLLHEAANRSEHRLFATSAYQALARYRATMASNPFNAALPPPREPDPAARTGPAGYDAPESTERRGGIPIRITAREADVLTQLSLGGSYTDIGRALFITENTVKTHLTSLYRKLGVEKRSAALRVARERGLL